MWWNISVAENSDRLKHVLICEVELLQFLCYLNVQKQTSCIVTVLPLLNSIYCL